MEGLFDSQFQSPPNRYPRGRYAESIGAFSRARNSQVQKSGVFRGGSLCDLCPQKTPVEGASSELVSFTQAIRRAAVSHADCWRDGRSKSQPERQAVFLQFSRLTRETP